ncbi:serine protease inhibitor [Streptacidiphilus rugosus]|uniref:serine protease inhibitor n=1 Tax=Streptacidiphilus rugosus TaxID=405783 RepID=UPI0005628709|nr:serine protease inhibitor [Streptacidiphilus rugosus]
MPAASRGQVLDMTEVRKSAWPELVGVDVEEAEQVVRAERPDVVVEARLAGMARATGYRPERVRLIYNATTGRITQEPHIG